MRPVFVWGGGCARRADPGRRPDPDCPNPPVAELNELQRVRSNDRAPPSIPELTQMLKPLAIALFLGLTATGAVRAAGEPPDVKMINDAVRVARAMVASDDVYDRILAAGALVETGDKPALELLLKYLATNDFVLKRSAIDTLLSTNHPSGVDMIMREAERDDVTLTLMVESLAATPREDLEDVLLHALASDKAYVRKNALQALSNIDTEAVNAAVHEVTDNPKESPTVRAYGYYALASTGHGAEIDEQVLAIAQQGETPDEREVAAATLGLIDSAASKAMLQTLATKDSDGRVQLAAIASSAGLKDEEAIAKMIKLVAYGKPMEASVMAGAIRRLPTDMVHDMTRTLITCCPLTSDTATRVLESWGWVPNDAGFLIEWGLSHQEVDVRLQTLWLIGHRREAASVNRIREFLTDENPGIRTMAAWAIIHSAGGTFVGGVET